MDQGDSGQRDQKRGARVIGPRVLDDPDSALRARIPVRQSRREFTSGRAGVGKARIRRGSTELGPEMLWPAELWIFFLII